MPRARWERATVLHDCNESLANTKSWHAQLSGGLPADFDYCLIQSEMDAKTLILELPKCDRGRAAAELYRHRDLIGNGVVYRGIMVAWNHDHREVIESFGSSDQFIAALTEVAPCLESSLSRRIEAWRGAVLSKDDSLWQSVGPSWTRNRDVACWFALRDYVPILQPSLTPLVLHAKIDRSLVVAQHDERTEQELIVDPSRLLVTTNSVKLDGVDDTWLSETKDRITDFCSGREDLNRLLANWRRAAARYEHWKSRLRPTCGKSR